MRMRRIMLPTVASFFPHYLISGTIFRSKILEHKMCVLIFSATSVCNISDSQKNSAGYYHKCTLGKGKGKAVPLQAWRSPEGSRKLRFQDFVTTAQDGGKLSALGTGRLYPQEILLVLISVRA